jgi:hypothetical protein
LQLADAGAAPGASTAAAADLVHAAGAVIDHRVDVAVRGGMAEADQHVVKLKLLFKIGDVKGDAHGGLILREIRQQ